MVDVSGKPRTDRTATAAAVVRMSVALRARLVARELPKGDAIAVVRIAAISGTKETSRLLPLCHPIGLTGVTVHVEPEGDDAIRIEVTTRCSGETGVEMEAMTGAAVGALALYDMLKGIERDVRIDSIALLHKAGGRSGEWRAPHGTTAPRSTDEAAP